MLDTSPLTINRPAKHNMQEDLIDAVCEENLAAVTRILEGDGKLALNVEQDGYTATLWAAKRGHAAILETLLSAGASLTPCDPTGQTAVHKATAGGAVECLRLLIDAGAALGQRDAMGRTALDVAVTCEQQECETMLREAGGRCNLVGMMGDAEDEAAWRAKTGALQQLPTRATLPNQGKGEAPSSS